MKSNNKEIYCQECSNIIKNREELAVTTYFLSLVPYHDRCFSKALKGCQTIFVGNEPINGFSGNLKAVLALLAIPILFFVGQEPVKYAAFILMVIPVIRFSSWIIYERHLKK